MTGSQDRAKLWGGRFGVATHELADQLNASLPFDRRLARQDVAGSVAHARMLARQGIISNADADAIVAGLGEVLREIEAGTFEYRLSDEDIHMAVEGRLRELIGTPAGRLHTARSRNDQVALDLRMWVREALGELERAVLDAAAAMLALGERYPDAIMPGYTHLQRAQPVLFAHHTHAYTVMFLRDVERLGEIYQRVNVLPLGAGALAGVTHPIDRVYVAELLNFERVSANSLDTIADRDYVLETLFALSLIGTHLSRLAEELILWTTAEFGFAELDDAFSTGSSIMPQKKNADVAELMRGKAGRVYGALVAMLTVVKGTPLTYNKDFQEDKEGLFDAVDTVLALLRVLPPMLATMTMQPARMAAAAIGGFSLATDVADELARRGVPFREAHELVGRLVAQCIAEGTTLESLTPAQWAEVHVVFADAPPVVTLEASVAARDVPGGTAPARVRAAYTAAHTELDAARARAGTRRTVTADLEQLLAVTEAVG